MNRWSVLFVLVVKSNELWSDEDGLYILDMIVFKSGERTDKWFNIQLHHNL